MDGKLNHRLRHDSAWAGSIHVVEIIKNALPPEEQREAFNAVYEALLALLECHELMLERERQRLMPVPAPSSN